jgi:ABC-type uncharacterized transport system substrate-binding protein
MIYLKTITLFLSLLLTIPLFAAEGAGERILFLQSYPVGERGHRLNKGFEKTVRQRFPKAEIRFESLDYNKLLPVFIDFSWEKFRADKKLVPAERKRLHEIIKSYNPTILAISDDEVAEVVHPLPENTDFPIFIMGMNRPIKEISWYKENPSRYVGGIEDEKPMHTSLMFLREMMHVKKIALVTSNGMTSKLVANSTLEAFKSYSKRLVKERGEEASVEVVKLIKSSSWEEWKKELKAIDDEIDLIWMLVPYQVYDESQQEMKVSKMGKWLVKELNTPTVGISDVNVKIGALFAQASDSESVGRQLGEQVQGYLLSKGVQEIGFERRLGYDYFVNRDTAERFNIRIPKDRLEQLKVVYTSKIREKQGTK